MSRIIRYIIAMILGVVAVFLVQFMVTKLWNAAGITWGPNNLPINLNQQIGMLSSAFIAGVIGPCIAVVIAKKKALFLIISFLLIGLSIDLYAAIVPLKPVAMWFRITWVLSVPLQIYLGIEFGGRIIKSKNLQ